MCRSGALQREARGSRHETRLSRGRAAVAAHRYAREQVNSAGSRPAEVHSCRSASARQPMSRPCWRLRGSWRPRGCGQRSRSETRCRTPRRERRAKARWFSIEHWRSPPAKAAFCLNPASRDSRKLRSAEKFCGMTGQDERGPAFWGLGGLMAEPRGPCIRAGPPYQRYSAEPVPCSTQARAQRRPRGPEAAAGHPPTCGHPGRVAGHRCNWCTRTATAAPKLRRTQLSSACRTPGTPSGPDGAWPSVFPLRWHSSSVEIASSSWPIKIRSGSRTVACLLDSVAAQHSTLGSDVEGCVME